jgi:hypothetical protein
MPIMVLFFAIGSEGLNNLIHGSIWRFLSLWIGGGLLLGIPYTIYIWQKLIRRVEEETAKKDWNTGTTSNT